MRYVASGESEPALQTELPGTKLLAQNWQKIFSDPIKILRESLGLFIVVGYFLCHADGLQTYLICITVRNGQDLFWQIVKRLKNVAGRRRRMRQIPHLSKRSEGNVKHLVKIKYFILTF